MSRTRSVNGTNKRAKQHGRWRQEEDDVKMRPWPCSEPGHTPRPHDLGIRYPEKTPRSTSTVRYPQNTLEATLTWILLSRFSACCVLSGLRWPLNWIYRRCLNSVPVTGFTKDMLNIHLLSSEKPLRGGVMISWRNVRCGLGTNTRVLHPARPLELNHGPTFFCFEIASRLRTRQPGLSSIKT